LALTSLRPGLRELRQTLLYSSKGGRKKACGSQAAMDKTSVRVFREIRDKKKNNPET
jgi:hypothetical protein